MRTLIFILALLPLSMAAQSTAVAKPDPENAIKWLSIQEAQAQAKKTPKPLMVDVYTSWCGPCKMLDARTFSDPRLAEFVNKNFYPVKFNAESGEPVDWKGTKLENKEFNPAMTGGRNGTHDLTRAIAPANGRIAYPTIVYLDSDLNVLAPVQGYMTPDQMEPILHYFGGGHYKTQDYQTYVGSYQVKWGQ